MTPIWVVDSSVAYKWFADEAGSEEARALLTSHRDGDVSLIAPSLLLVEVANALRCAGLPEADLLSAMEALAHLHIDTVEPRDELLSSACSLAILHEMTVYDALFLALAIDRGASLVTADRKAFAQIPAEVCPIRLI